MFCRGGRIDPNNNSICRYQRWYWYRIDTSLMRSILYVKFFFSILSTLLPLHQRVGLYTCHLEPSALPFLLFCCHAIMWLSGAKCKETLLVVLRKRYGRKKKKKKESKREKENSELQNKLRGKEGNYLYNTEARFFINCVPNLTFL